MQNKSIRPNILPAQSITATSVTSATQTANFERGMRFFIVVSGPTAAGGTDAFYLCAVPPKSTTAIPLTGCSAVNMLSVAGTYAVDFYPSATLPPTTAPAQLLGVFGVELPDQFAVKVTMGVGNAATVTVHGVTML